MDESIVKHLEQQKQITKLSQAIREGAKLRPQRVGRLFRDGGSCAVGAAYEVVFGYPENADERAVNEGGSWCWALHKKFDLPIDKTLPRWIGQEMNDAGMSREAIADKLEAEGY